MAIQMRVTDGRSGRAVPLPGRPGAELLVGVGPGDDPGGLWAARALVVADTLARAADAIGRRRVRLLLAGPPLGAEAEKRLRALADSLWTAPPAGDAEAEPLDLRVAASAEGSDVPVLVVGEVDAQAAVPADAQVLRLALLSAPHDAATELTEHHLEVADNLLARWRERVAEWARHPSRPVPESVAGRAQAALAEGLDAPALLRLAREVEGDEQLPPGARFEAFASFDRLLALDLMRGLGSA